MEEVDYTLPSPTDTPYRTPSSTQSRRSHAGDDVSSSSSPPPLPSNDWSRKRNSHDSLQSVTALDENISPLDPRRFTPTLHASLVSEILSLRRDLESRTQDIERLEDRLHATQGENERLTETLSTSNKDGRNLKRQMQMLESGTMSAISEMSKERDGARNEAGDLRRRLDQSQKRAKTSEDAVERAQTSWDRERERWTHERRALETKCNVVEGRLKVVLSEMSNYAQQANLESQGGHVKAHRASFGDSSPKRSTSAFSNRRQSAASTTSDHLGGRLSALGHVNPLSNSLADELAFDEEDEYDENVSNGRQSIDALPEELERPMSSLSFKAHKVLGLVSVFEGADRLRSTSRQSLRDDLHLASHAKTSSTSTSPLRTVLKYSPILSTNLPPIEPLALPPKATESKSSAPPPHFAATPNKYFEPEQQEASVRQTPAMQSSACQTSEMLPSPPFTPQGSPKVDSYTMSNPSELKSEMASTSTQTEAFEQHGLIEVDTTQRDDFRHLAIPTIAIIPPGSRPATPESSVMLPPRTKNASCQVDLELKTACKSFGTQTDDILSGRRPFDLPPISTGDTSHARPTSYGKGILPNTSRRRFYQVMPAPPTDEQHKRSSTITQSTLSNESSVSRRDYQAVYAPARSSSLYSGFDEDDDNLRCVPSPDFEDDDFFNRPTAKYTLKYGKMVSQDFPLEDVDELAAADAGEAVALDNLRQSEDGMLPEFQTNFSGRTSPRRRGAPNHLYKQIRRVPSPKRFNIRKAALITSGTAAHSAQSSVRSSSDMIRASIDSNPPPFPVPVRFSSARIGKSFSEGGRSSPASSRASPTRRERHRRQKPTLRKTRSGPAVSPTPEMMIMPSGNQSPGLVDSRVSIVPDMPTFRMPTENAIVPLKVYGPNSDASAPRPSVATGPNRKTTHKKSTSDAVSLQSTSVVDAIAQTMVGEWMLKYVRRRKSFGVTESRVMDYDPTKNAEEISANVTNAGVRHKRWVWLAPYEKSVMWSSKQPTSNAALLGKSGRKLMIQSVLDVKDDNPLPKGVTTGHHFSRSILILTPQRALKFTALTQDRHYIWLTALSFLSHSPLSLGDLAIPPPPTSGAETRTSSQHSFAGSLRRRPIRDSIRIAKGVPRPEARAFTTDGSLPVQLQDMVHRERQLMAEDPEYYDPSNDAALPPTIPRFTAHTRKRSNTAPRVPPSSYKSFATKDNVTALPLSNHYAQSVATSASGTGRYTPSLGVKSFGSRTSSRRNSEASGMGRPNVPMNQGTYDTWTPPNVNVNGGITSTGTRTGTLASNTGSATGTMRMDAFIEDKPPPPPSHPMPQQHTMPYPLPRTGFASGLRRIGRKSKDPSTAYWAEEGRGSSPMRTEMEQMLLSDGPVINGIYGSTRGMMVHSPLELEVGGGDPFRGF